MKNECLKRFILLAPAGSIFALIILSGNVNTVEAKLKKGVNIIKYQMSSSSLPSQDRNEIRALIEQRGKATTESEVASINKKLQELENEMTAWFKSREDLEKEEEVLKKLDLLLDAIHEERLTKEGKENLKKVLPFTRLGYDYISHSLEVSIDPKRFNDEEIKGYIEYVRNIIGDEVDLTISRCSYGKTPLSKPAN